MYSWKTIRTFCAVLLCLPLIHLVILISRDTAAMLNASPTAWQGEMDAYIEHDSQSILPASPVVVVGGRRVAIWPNLDLTVAPKPVLVRALGDATIDDIIYYHDRLIAHYQPRVVVLAISNSEFHLRANKSAEQVLTGLKTLIELDSQRTTPRLFYVILPVKTVLHRDDHVTIDETNKLILNWARAQRSVRIIDPNPVLASLDGDPDPAFFRADGVQLNESGYLRMDFLLRRQLGNDYPREYRGADPR